MIQMRLTHALLVHLCQSQTQFFQSPILYPEGIQNEPSQYVQLWYIDYFELKAIKTKHIQEKLLPLSYLPKIIQNIWSRKKAITRGNYRILARWDGLGKLAWPICSDLSLCPIVSSWNDKHLSNICSLHVPINCHPHL